MYVRESDSEQISEREIDDRERPSVSHEHVMRAVVPDPTLPYCIARPVFARWKKVPGWNFQVLRFSIKFHPYSAGNIYAPIELLSATADVQCQRSSLSNSSLAKNSELADNSASHFKGKSDSHWPKSKLQRNRLTRTSDPEDRIVL